MKKPNINEAFKSLKRSTSKYSPQILTGLGIAGVVTTTVLAIKATPKAIQLIEEKKEEKNDILTPMEVVKTTWKCYIPTAVSMATSITCLICANSVNTKRNAALAAAYKISETAFIEYKDKVVETIGEKKEKTVREKVAEDKVKNNPPTQNTIIMTDSGTELFLEPVSGRYFKSDMEKIRRIENECNKKMLHDINGYMSLNDFYDELGLEHSSIGYELGWNSYNLLEIDYIPQLLEDDKVCVVLEYTTGPKYDYMDF
jgi:hypothetical protein